MESPQCGGYIQQRTYGCQPRSFANGLDRAIAMFAALSEREVLHAPGNPPPPPPKRGRGGGTRRIRDASTDWPTEWKFKVISLPLHTPRPRKQAAFRYTRPIPPLIASCPLAFHPPPSTSATPLYSSLLALRRVDDWLEDGSNCTTMTCSRKYPGTDAQESTLAQHLHFQSYPKSNCSEGNMVKKIAGLTSATPNRMNWKTSANSNIMEHISPDDEGSGLPQVNENPLSSKSKCAPASFGIASDFIRKDYLIPKPPSASSFETGKPLRLGAMALPISEFSQETSGSHQMDKQVDSNMTKDMEDFLLQMLGQGFNIERDTIGKVLRSCGYDMPKTLEDLIDLSDGVVQNKSSSHEESSEKMFRQHEVPQWKLDSEDSNHIGHEVARQKMEKVAIQREIMSSLFKLPVKEDENECGDPYAKRKYKPIREVVNVAVEEKTEETKPPQNDGVEQAAKEEEGDYQLLRKAVAEYRESMREYYKAAIEAYSKGDRAKANKLSEKGQFFYRKAREADEESNCKVYEIRNNGVQHEETFPLDLSELDAREALRILKLHLKSLGGSLAFKYMKVTIEGRDGDASRGARRKRIMKLMEKESVKWKDGGEAGSILITLS
ncbi:hypothetical protein MLD38_027534 [Melastoma candidum]|uniref:Uncharacterized protein n=1 Tax=Melastoma candidum TaxID=119954 RepID=A0ACB9P3D6_9MYRT|nr:hypothetical protein MLD38_027534 [Melastoma candidum]